MNKKMTWKRFRRKKLSQILFVFKMKKKITYKKSMLLIYFLIFFSNCQIVLNKNFRKKRKKLVFDILKIKILRK